MEGIVRYRLLGSHPACSGRVLQVGFRGTTFTVRELLKKVIEENYINETSYRLEPIKVSHRQNNSNNNNNNEEGNTGVGNSNTPATLQPSDVLETYDQVDITIHKRTLQEAQQQQQQQQKGGLGVSLSSSSADFPSATSFGTDIPPSNYGSSSSRLPPDGQEDPYELERALKVAARSYPLQKASRGADREDSASSAATCVLCELPLVVSSSEKSCNLTTECCAYTVCRVCYQAARDMCLGGTTLCPICGQNRQHRSPSTATGAAASSSTSEGKSGLKSKVKLSTVASSTSASSSGGVKRGRGEGEGSPPPHTGSSNGSLYDSPYSTTVPHLEVSSSLLEEFTKTVIDAQTGQTLGGAFQAITDSLQSTEQLEKRLALLTSPAP